jgi:hypothetical protein
LEEIEQLNEGVKMSMYFIYRQGSHAKILDVSDPAGYRLMDIAEEVRPGKYKLSPEQLPLARDALGGFGSEFLIYLESRKTPVTIWQKD